MSSVTGLDVLTGTISAKSSLNGTLSCSVGLAGSLSVSQEYDAYVGDYRITPSRYDAHTLLTAHKVMSENVVVSNIPYWEIDNESDGITAYIAKEV